MNNALAILLLAYFASGSALAADKTATSEQLGKLLKEMGYDPQALSDEVWQVSVDRDNWKVHIMIALTRDADRVWLESKFAPIADPAIVPASAWLKLLEENERISPAHFAYDKSDKRIHLYRAFDNQNVAAARIKKEIEAFDAIVRRTQAVWRAENFAPIETLPIVPREAPKDPAALFNGKWRIVRIELKGESTTSEKLPKDPFLAIDGTTAILNTGLDPERKVTLRVDPTRKPAQIDFIDNERIEHGIYHFQGELLTICVAPAGADRPKQFATQVNGKTWLLILKKDE